MCRAIEDLKMNVQISELKNFSDIKDTDEILISHYEGNKKISYATTMSDLYAYFKQKLMADTGNITINGNWTINGKWKFNQEIDGTARAARWS